MKNNVSFHQIEIACRHYFELRKAGVTKNLSIRTVELFIDVYAKVYLYGNANPHSIWDVKDERYWSIKAIQKRDILSIHKGHLTLRAGDHFRVEHGTPRRALASLVLCRYGRKTTFDESSLRQIIDRHWRLAVITLEEDRHLNKLARARPFETPEARWAEAGIHFHESSLPPPA